MIFRKAVLFVAAAAVASSVSAFAQAGVYGMFTVDRLSNIDSSPIPPLSSNPQDTRLQHGRSTGRNWRNLLRLHEAWADSAGCGCSWKHSDDQARSLCELQWTGYEDLLCARWRTWRLPYEVCAAEAVSSVVGGSGTQQLRPDYRRPTTNNGQTVIHNNFQYEGWRGWTSSCFRFWTGA